MNQLKKKKKKRNVFNQETTIGVTTRLGTSLTMVLRKVHRLRLASQENVEIARHWPELMGYPATRSFSLEWLLTFTKSLAPLVSRDYGRLVLTTGQQRERRSTFFQSVKRDYSYLLTLSDVREPSWIWIPSDQIRVQKAKYHFVIACLRYP